MNEVVIRPLRFSADIEAMRSFLELLGLRSRVESERGGWIDLLAGHGMVALHDAATSDTGGRPGQTNLSFEAEDVDRLRERLLETYDDATVWDEAFGRVLTLTGPGGTRIWIDERSKDLYGYKLHPAQPDPRWSVTPCLLGADEPEWERFLDRLGAEARVHYEPGSDFGVRLEFTTTEGLADVMSRLTAAGYEPRPGDGAFTVVDPDGHLVRVRG